MVSGHDGFWAIEHAEVLIVSACRMAASLPRPSQFGAILLTEAKVSLSLFIRFPDMSLTAKQVDFWVSTSRSSVTAGSPWSDFSPELKTCSILGQTMTSLIL